MSSQDVVGYRRDRRKHGGRNISGAMIWLEVGEAEDCINKNKLKQQHDGFTARSK